MTDVFISYSRRDKVFTQKLVDALQAAQREVWADWASIPAASDWDAEIKEGIEKTNTVLFLLSPEWIKSNECRKELIHAVQMGKRLLPILHIMPAEGQEVPPELAKLNWVYMRESDDFDKAFQTLQGAMDTDLDWIKIHTRIQVRALEWDKKNKSASFALRGEDLAEGEQFISGASGKSPEPTPLQGEYILLSRKDATRRQRQTIAGVTIALLVSIVLGIAAFFQRQEAVAQRATAQANLVVAQTARSDSDNNAATAVANEQEAKRQAQIALARQLASQAQFINSAHSSNQMIASLLNIQSMKLFPNADAANFLLDNNRSPELIRNVEDVESVDVSPGAKYMVVAIGNTAQVWDIAKWEEVAHMTHDDVVKSVKFSPDGQYVRSDSQDKTARVWEAMTGKELLRTSKDVEWSLFAFSPDGAYVVSGSGDNTVNLWETMTGREVASMTYGDAINSIAFSPDGKYVVTAGNLSNVGTLGVWDAESGKDIAQMLYHGVDQSGESSGNIYAVAFSPDGKYVVAGGADRVVTVWDAMTGNEIASTLHDSSVTSALTPTFSPDGKYVISSGFMEENTRVWEAMTGNIIADLKHNGAVTSFAFSPDGTYVVSGDTSGTTHVWETMTGKEVASTKHDGGVLSATFSPDGKYVVSTGSDHIVRMSEALTGKELAHITGVNSAWLGPEDRYLLTLSDGHILQMWDAVGVKGNIRLIHGAQMVLVAFSPDGKYVISNGGLWGDNTARVWDMGSGKEIAAVPSYSPYAAFSPDGKYILSSDGSDVHVWEALTGKDIAHITQDTRVWAMAFSPDGKFIVSSDDNNILVWEALTGREISRIPHDDAINVVAYSPDGAYVVSGSNDKTARVWDAMTGKEIARMTHDGSDFGSVYNVVFSPDGKYIISGSGDGTARVWEAMTGKEIARMTHDGGISDAAFSPDGKYIISVSGDGTIRVWAWQPMDMIANACLTMSRNLTRAEWAQFIGDAMPYQAVCDNLPIETEVTSTPTP